MSLIQWPSTADDGDDLDDDDGDDDDDDDDDEDDNDDDDDDDDDDIEETENSAFETNSDDWSLVWLVSISNNHFSIKMMMRT